MNKKNLLSLIFSSYIFLTLFVDKALAAVDTINFGGNQPAGVIATSNPRILDIVLRNGIRIFFVVGAIAMVFMIAWGALEWVISGGDKEKVGAARKKIAAGIIGFVILALVFVIAQIVGQIVKFNPLDPQCLPILSAPANANPTDLNNCL